MKQIINSADVNLTYDEKSEQLIATYNGFVRSSEFRNAIDKIMEITKLEKVSSLLVNSLNQGPVGPKDNEYASASLSFLAENGMKYMAFVMPQQAITAMGVKRFSKLNNSEVQLGHFTDLNEAEGWISKEGATN